MKPNFYSNATPPPSLEKPADINIGLPTSTTAEQRHVDLVDACADITQFSGDTRFPFRRRGETSESVYLMDSVFLAFGSGGATRQLSVDKCELVSARDPDGKATLVRKRSIGRSPDGEPIFSSFSIPLWKFVRDFEPQGSWIQPSEWAALVESCAPVLAADERAEASNAAFLAESSRRLEAARASRQNPEASLGTAIAAGVAAALRDLGLAPKSKP